MFCNSVSKELVLIDDDLKLKEKIPYDGGWIQDCTRLPNGHILVTSMDARKVVEFNREGKEVWKQETPGRPFCVRRY